MIRRPGDLYDMGTIGTILQLLKLPDGTVKVLVEGGKRVQIKKLSKDDNIFIGFSMRIEPELAEAKS